jgi:hypothetical protein
LVIVSASQTWFRLFEFLSTIVKGMCLFARRLERGRFLWLSTADDLDGAAGLSSGGHLANATENFASDAYGMRILAYKSA